MKQAVLLPVALLLLAGLSACSPVATTTDAPTQVPTQSPTHVPTPTPSTPATPKIKIAEIEDCGGVLCDGENDVSTHTPTGAIVGTVSGSGGVLETPADTEHISGVGGITLTTPEGETLTVQLIDGAFSCKSETIPSFPCGEFTLDLYSERVKR